MSDDNDDLEAVMDVADDAPAAGADDTDPSDAIEAQDPATGFPAGGIGRRGGREVSEKTRELMRAAAGKVKAQLGDYGDGDMEPALDTPDDDPPGVAAAGQPAAIPPPKGTPAPAAASAAPAPSLDPAVTAERQRLVQVREDLDKRAQAIAERDAAGDIARLGDRYHEDPKAAVIELLKQWTGAATDEALNAEVNDLITSLSERVGVVLSPETKEKLAGRLTLKQAKRELAKVAQERQGAGAKAQAAQEAAQRTQAATAISGQLAQPAHREKYPWLAAEDDAGGLVVDVYQHALKTEGVQIHWTEAARRADEYLSKQASAWHDKRKHLFTAAPAKPATPAANAPRSPGAPTGIRGARAVTNAQASATTAPPQGNPALVDGKFSMEAHRAASRRKMRAAFTRSTDE